MERKRLTFCLLILAALLLPAAVRGEGAKFHGPLLQWHRDPARSVTFAWVEPNAGASRRDPEGSDWSLGIRRRGSTGSHVEAAIEKRRFGKTSHAVIESIVGDLRPDTEYEYVLRAGKTAAKSGWFRTAPDRLGRSMKFVAGGDMNTDLSIPVSRLAAKEDPLFALVGGDLAYGNGWTVKKWFAWLDIWSETMVTASGRDIPIIAAIGNHETRGGLWSSKGMAPFYFSLFDLPAGESNFTVDFSDYLSFVVLDSDHGQSVRSQTAWLEQALKARKPVPHLFAVYHTPAWGTGVKPNNTAIQKRWCPLIEKYGVDCVFENDHHVYKRSQKIVHGVPDALRGVLYLGDGAWGSESRPITDRDLDKVGARTYLAKWAAVNHMISVTISPDGMKHYRAKSPDLGVFDEFRDPGTAPASEAN